MKKVIMSAVLMLSLTTAVFAQSQRLSRTNRKTADAAKVVLPTEKAINEEAKSGVTGVDGTLNDEANSGRNRSSGMDTTSTPAKRKK